MTDTDFQTLTRNPSSRAGRYTELVRAYYDRITAIMLEKWGESFHFAMFQGDESLDEALAGTERWVADRGGFRPGMKVLDIGCGVGGPALTIAAHSGAHVTGINIVEPHVLVARDRAASRGLTEQTTFILGDAMAMPFPLATFDAAYVFEAGCHMPDKPLFYRECARVLKPGGVFVGTDWFKREDLTPAEEAEYIEPICRLHGVPHVITLTDLRRHLGTAGFQVEAVENLAVHGDVLRNWEQIDRRAMRLLNTYLRFIIPKVERMMLDGGLKLVDAARKGFFLVGSWKAVKQA
jgi:cyclopropane fatty-acyl-phospholipid synthase-like methyltransferase